MFEAHLAILLLSATLGAAEPCTVEIATVADFKGTWVDHGATLVKHSLVCVESQIQRTKDARPAAGDFIKLAPRSGRQSITFECRLLLGCEKPLDLGPLIRDEQRKLRGASLLESFMAAFTSRTTPTITRKTEPGGREDSARGMAPRTWHVSRAAVIVSGSPIRSDTVFGPETPAGTYDLYLCPSPASDESCGSPPTRGRRVSWQPASPANLPFTAPAPGVFLLYRVSAEDVARRTPDRMLIVAVDRAGAAATPELIAEARDKLALAALSDGARSGDAFERYVKLLALSLPLEPAR